MFTLSLNISNEFRNSKLIRNGFGINEYNVSYEVSEESITDLEFKRILFYQEKLLKVIKRRSC